MARQRSSGRRADYAWAGASFFRVAQTTGGSANSVAILNGPGTIVRTRGEILGMMDVGAAGDTAVLGFGIIIIDDDAFAAGAGSIPSPVLDTPADWLWHGWMPLRSETGTQSDDQGSHVGRLTIDSKAMRRVKQNDNVVFVGDVNILAGTPTVDWAVGCRTLLAT